MIELTDGQKRGLDLAKRLIDNPRTTGIICGYAGTGKTTLVKSLLDELQGTAVLLSPTGKAAARLTEVTGRGAGTIHRWLYTPREKEGVLSFVRKKLEEIARPESGLVIIDEASMIGPDVWNDLQETSQILNCSILLVGDGFQLPPVQEKGEEPFSVMTPEFVAPKWRVELTEILRQALDSPIIRTTMAIREGDIYEVLMDLDPLLPSELDSYLERADMVICRTNKARHILNRRCRDLRGIKGELQVGEPLLVLKNTTGLDAYNGEVHQFRGFIDNLHMNKVYDPILKTKVDVNFQISPWGVDQRAILAPRFVDGTLDLPGWALESAVKSWQAEKRGADRAFYLHANLGYALTCHKAQGSEADTVLVCMEKFNYTSIEGRRWLYTAMTRARKKAVTANVDFTSSP